MNRKSLFFIAIAAVTFIAGGCLKSNTSTQSNCVANNTGIPTAAEIASLQTYLTAKSITATQDSRGFFYTIVAPGTGANPSLSSYITVKYSGSLENGSVFDAPAGNKIFLLSGLIPGWKLGVPLIKKGGSIKLYLPPSLGYGCSAQSTIPAGSNLIFSIDLIDVQ